MKLNDPKRIRQDFAEKQGWLTIEEISIGLAVSNKTVSDALAGKPLRPNTVRKIAQAIEKEPGKIATFVN